MGLMKFLLFTIISCLLAVTAHATQALKPPADYHIVILGDQFSSDADMPEQFHLSTLIEEQIRYSIKEIPQYSAMRVKKLQVTNLSAAGLSILTAPSYVDYITQVRPDIVIVQLGTNDALAQQDPSLLESALGRLLVDIRGAYAYPILVSMRAPKHVPHSYSAHYNLIFGNTAARNKVHHVQDYMKDLEGNWELLMADEITPNEQGKEVLAKKLTPYILQAIREVYGKRIETFDREKELEQQRKAKARQEKWDKIKREADERRQKIWGQ